MRLVISGKDPDALYQDTTATEGDHDKIAKFFEFGEYYELELNVDPETGEGTVKMREMK
jgi:hypothetical protein